MTVFRWVPIGDVDLPSEPRTQRSGVSGDRLLRCAACAARTEMLADYGCTARRKTLHWMKDPRVLLKPAVSLDVSLSQSYLHPCVLSGRGPGGLQAGMSPVRHHLSV